MFDELSEFVGFATLFGLRLVVAVPCGNKEPLHCIEVFFAFRSSYSLRRVLVIHGQSVIADNNHDGFIQFESVLIVSIDGQGFGRAHGVTTVGGVVCGDGLAVSQRFAGGLEKRLLIIYVPVARQFKDLVPQIVPVFLDFFHHSSTMADVLSDCRYGVRLLLLIWYVRFETPIGIVPGSILGNPFSTR